jgi:uncharacterized surface protein with fasciclin (FAS1) repeats
MWTSSVWPTKFARYNNAQGEVPKFDPNADIIDKKLLSNGFFYGTGKVQQASVFSTVYGRAYLDPKYLIMTRALDLNYRYTITVPSLKFTVIMMSDSLLRAKGFDYNTLRLDWQYTTPGTGVITYGAAARDMLLRILATHIIPTPNNELDNISGSGIVESLNGEYIKYNANKFVSAGSLDSGFVINSKGTKASSNGRVYYADNLLTYSITPLANTIINLGAASTSEYYNFAQYLKNSPLYAAATGSLLGVQTGVFYTVFVPNNAAVLAAVAAGLLPKNANGTPNFAPTLQAERDLVSAFLLYHFLNKNTVVPDGKKSGTYETLYKKLSGDAGIFTVSGAAGSMQVTDVFGRVSNVIVPSSNNLADRAVIHLIDNYLQYSPN